MDMKHTIKVLECLMPRHNLFHCVLFALAFSHFLSSPTARAVMNDYVDHALISKIGLEISKKDETQDATAWEPCLLQPELSTAPLYADSCCYAFGHTPIVSTLNLSISSEHLLL